MLSTITLIRSDYFRVVAREVKTGMRTLITGTRTLIKGRARLSTKKKNCAAAGKKKVKGPADTAGSSVDKKGKQPKKKKFSRRNDSVATRATGLFQEKRDSK